jgi:hypothetical protein
MGLASDNNPHTQPGFASNGLLSHPLARKAMSRAVSHPGLTVNLWSVRGRNLKPLF